MAAAVAKRPASPVGSYVVQHFPERTFHHVGGDDLKLMPVITEIFNRILTPLYGPQDKAINQIRESKDRRAYLLYEGETPVGVLVFKTVLSDEFAEFGVKKSVEVKSLFVDQSQKNSGRGLGSTLVNKLKKEVQNLNLGNESIHVTVSETKQESLLFFKKKGFEIVHTWDGRYLKGIKEHLLSCPAKATKVAKVFDELAEKFAALMRGDAKAPSERYAPELVHIIHDAHHGDIHGLIKLSDGTFVSGSKDNSMYKWNAYGKRVKIVDEVEPLNRTERDWITAMTVLNDEYWISGKRNGDVCLWDTQGEYIRQIKLKMPSRDHFSHAFNTRRVTCLAPNLDPFKPGFFAGFPTMFDEFNLFAERTESITKTHANDWVYCLEPLSSKRLLAVTACTLDIWEKKGSHWRKEKNIIWEGKKRKVEVNGKTSYQRPFISSIKPLDKYSSLYALSMFDGSARVLNLNSQKIVKTFREHQGRVWSVEPLTKQVFATSGEDRSIKFWDIRQSQSVHTIADHVGPVTAMLNLSDSVLIAGTCPPENGNISQNAQIRFYDIRK